MEGVRDGGGGDVCECGCACVRVHMLAIMLICHCVPTVCRYSVCMRVCVCVHDLTSHLSPSESKLVLFTFRVLLSLHYTVKPIYTHSAL